MYFNADSLVNKMDELKLLLDEHTPMVVGITDLTPNNYRTEIQQAELSMDGYQCLSNLQRAKRGVCIYTHESLGCIECRAMADEDSEESVWSEMKLTGNDRLLIGCIYRSPDSTIANDDKINELLRRTEPLAPTPVWRSKSPQYQLARQHIATGRKPPSKPLLNQLVMHS